MAPIVTEFQHTCDDLKDDEKNNNTEDMTFLKMMEASISVLNDITTWIENKASGEDNILCQGYQGVKTLSQ